MASPSAVLTLGYGSWGSVAEAVTLGFGGGVSLVPGSLPTVDTFTDPNGTDLEDHVPDDGDGRWRVILGTATTQGGGARVPGVDEQLAVIDVGSPDYTFSLEFSSDLGTESHTFVIFRYADADNFWAVRNALGDFDLVEVTGGTETVRASGSTGGNHPCRIVVTCDGDDITAATEEIDGTARGDPITYSSATHNDATAVGFWVKAGGTTVFFDNLNVEEIEEPAAEPEFATGGSWMLARLRAIMPQFRRYGDLRRVTFYPRTSGDTYGEGVGYWGRREPQRRALEDGIIVIRAVWHLYRVDDPLQTVIPTPMGKVVDSADGTTWNIPMDGQVTRGYRDPEVADGYELKFDMDCVLSVS